MAKYRPIPVIESTRGDRRWLVSALPEGHGYRSDTAMQSRRLATLFTLTFIVQVAVALDIQTVRFPAGDGYQIAADYVAPAKGKSDPAMCVLIHGERETRKVWPKELLELLHQEGFATLSIDLRGFGESASSKSQAQIERRDEEVYQRMNADVRGAYDWLAARPSVDRSRFVIIAHGTGTAVALQYAARDASVDAVLCISPELDLPGINAAGDMRQIVGQELHAIGGAATAETCSRMQSGNQACKVEIVKFDESDRAAFLSEPTNISTITRLASNGAGPAAKVPLSFSIESDKKVCHQKDSGWIPQIKPTNLRVFSTKDEAEARGYRLSKSKGPGARDDAQNKKKKDKR